MTAELVVLGAGSILPRDGYGCAGYAFRDGDGSPWTLLDCGPGSVRMLGRVGIELEDVRRVVFSHYHLDHCLDVFALAFARRNPRFDPPPLELFGPVGLANLIDEAPRALGRWAIDPDARVIEVDVDDEGRGGFVAGDLRFDCRRTEHNVEAVAWRVTFPGGTALGYTGDTGPNPVLADHFRGVDLLLAECSFPEDEATDNHLTPHGAGALAAAAKAERLVLSHFYPSMDPEQARGGAGERFSGPIELARDGSRHGIG